MNIYWDVLQPEHVLKKKSESRDVLFMLAILDITTSPANLQHFSSRKNRDLLVPATLILTKWLKVKISAKTAILIVQYNVGANLFRNVIILPLHL